MSYKLPKLQYLKKVDKSLYNIIINEQKRQQNNLEMVASENYVSTAVLEASSTILTNKYCEGYPGNRYYGGQKYTDIIEQLAIDRAKKLFNAEHVNVQPLSGAPANMIAYFSVLKKGDKILSMDLSHGGHLTHGHPLTLVANIYNFIHYKTNKDGLIDYDQIKYLALKEKPKMILVGFSSYTRNIDYKKIKSIADMINAITMMDISHIAGLIAGKVLENPVPIFDIITTTTHKTLRGPRGGIIMCKKEFAKNIDKACFPSIQGGPHMHQIAAKAVCFYEALKPSFQKYARQVIKNAKVLEQEFKKYNYKLVFGGTDNHMILIDIYASKGINGKLAEEILDNVGITVNKNIIPDDIRSAIDPSGIRIGTPAVTTRGMKEKEMIYIAKNINDAFLHYKDKNKLKNIYKNILNLCKKFPIYK